MTRPSCPPADAGLVAASRALAVAAGLSFEPEAHAYALDGERVLSVTQVLRAVGLDPWEHVPPAVREPARRRGAAVHAAIHYLVEEDLDRDALDPRLAPYVLAYDRFRRDTGFVPDLVERHVVSRTYRFAGRLDQAGPWPPGGRAVIDVKSGLVAPATRLQLAGYALCLEGPHRRFALHLGADGRYRLSPEFTEANDRRLFLAALAVAQFKLGQRPR